MLGPRDVAGRAAGGAVLGPGTGDNAAAALGRGADPGDVVMSVGTSGVVSAVSSAPARDSSGIVAGFADATVLGRPVVVPPPGEYVADGAARQTAWVHS